MEKCGEGGKVEIWKKFFFFFFFFFFFCRNCGGAQCRMSGVEGRGGGGGRVSRGECRGPKGGGYRVKRRSVAQDFLDGEEEGKSC